MMQRTCRRLETRRTAWRRRGAEKSGNRRRRGDTPNAKLYARSDDERKTAKNSCSWKLNGNVRGRKREQGGTRRSVDLNG
jgi:hypothetical protein